MWCGCHGVPSPRCSAHPGRGRLEQDQQHCAREEHRDRGLHQGEHDPGRLRDDQAADEEPADRRPVRVLAAGAQPLEDHRHPHHDVAEHHHPVVEVVVVQQRLEHVGQAERQDDDADHLHHRGEPVDPVVGVVRRGEPGEVDPRPRHRERREREAEDPRPPRGPRRGSGRARWRRRRTRSRRSGRTAAPTASRHGPLRAGPGRPSGPRCASSGPPWDQPRGVAQARPSIGPSPARERMPSLR